MLKVFKKGAKGESNPRPLAPEARIIPLDHWPTVVAEIQKVATSAGFEPARAEPIGFQVQRLNHSAMMPGSLLDKHEGPVV